MPGFGVRVAYAVRCFFSLLLTGSIARDILDSVAPAAGPVAAAPTPAQVATQPAVAPREDPGERAVQLLALLQRDARLVDFLMEDLSGYSDAQVGTAVRDVHANCRQVLQRYAAIEPVLADEEGRPTSLQAPVDPSTIRLVGNVGTQARTRGTVRHRGWRVGRLELPPLPAEPARLVVAPAEVEVA
jgi:hypothetical protein